MKILILPWVYLLYTLPVFGQDKIDANFGKISPSDFTLSPSSIIDSNTNAVYLVDMGSTNFIGNKYHSFSFVFKRYVRIKIINEKAFDLATAKIRLRGFEKDKDQLSDLKAVTYNLKNGRIVTSSLQNTDVFEDKLSPYTSLKKFTFSALKKGSIIECSYTITSSHIYSIPSWFFQHTEYPCLYSQYKVVFPDVTQYLMVRYGLDSFSEKKSKIIKNNTYTMGDMSVISNDAMNSWTMKNVPAFMDEKFIGSTSDYLDKIEFFLAKFYNGEDVNDISATWRSVTDQLLGTNYFGEAIDKESSSNLSNTAEKITSGDKAADEVAKHLYYYVRDNFNCTPDDEIFLEDDLYDVNKKRKGNVAEINLLLIALLRQKGIIADPVVLSTKEYGKNPEDYPILDKMNYVICMARLGIDTIYLDASRPNLGFGNLSIDCYNGHARIISKNGGPVYFNPEKIHESKNTTVFIYNNNEKDKVSGSFAATYGTFGSESLRKEVKETQRNKYFDNLKSKLTGESDILHTGIDSLNAPEFPATVHFEFKIPASDETLYFNPVILSEYTTNPFKAEQRKYPVVLPYPIDDMYVLNMEIPEGYTVDELPKSARVSFNGDEGFFEYLVDKDQGRIQFRSHVKLNDIVFAPEDYNSLRDFFGFIIKKYSEQIVFKKKK